VTVTTTAPANWYLLRGTGIVALVLLTAVMALGIASSNRWAPASAPRFVTAAIHRSLSLLAVVFLVLHVVGSLADADTGLTWAQSFVPSATWVGIGALSLDLVAALIVTSLLRRHLAYRTWRAVHWVAYLSWPTAFAHSVGMGTDAPTLPFEIMALACLGVLLATCAWRILGARPGKRLDPQVVA
jgi:sulfoxide reductase heme-binding subunit YedZ